jgi:hypothetical protein
MATIGTFWIVMRYLTRGVLPLLLVALPLGAAIAADLQSRTAAAFDRYVKTLEVQMPARSTFLWVDRGGDAARRKTQDALARGELVIESIDRSDTGVKREVPDGMLHHWIGTVFVPGGTVNAALALLQDYDRHASVYAPAVTQSKLLSRNGDVFRMHLRFTMTRVITVVVNTESEAVFMREGRDRVRSFIRSTRVAEVENPGQPDERELPVGRDGGYLWRLNSYWRLLERDGGVYVECESISLSRDIPFGFGWVVKPFVTSLPKDSLSFTLETTRKVLAKR